MSELKKNKGKDEWERWKKAVKIEGTDGGQIQGREEVETKKRRVKNQGRLRNRNQR